MGEERFDGSWHTFLHTKRHTIPWLHELDHRFIEVVSHLHKTFGKKSAAFGSKATQVQM